MASGSNLHSAFELCCAALSPSHSGAPGPSLGLGHVCTQKQAISAMAAFPWLPTFSGPQRPLSLSLARSQVAFPAVWVLCAVAAPRRRATPLGKAQREKNGRKQAFPANPLGFSSAFSEFLGQKASIVPSVLGAALGATPERKEEPLHQETLHRGQPLPCVGSPLHGRLWLLDMSVAVSGWKRSWGNLTLS